MFAGWRTQRFFLAIVVTIAAFGSLGGPAFARPASHAHEAVWEYRNAHPGQPVPVIVQTTPATDPVAFVRAASGEVYAQLGMIHAVAAVVPSSRLEALAFANEVTGLSLDGPVTSTGTGSKSSTNPVSVYPQEVHADKVWSNGNYGQGVGIAIVDTGITPSPDFTTNGQSRIVASYSKDGTTGDGYGHGTDVAGLAAGNGSNSNGQYVGVAPQANLIAVKVGDDTGAAAVSDVINGLQFVLNNRDAYNIRVVNLSLRSSVSQSYTTDPLDAAVELLTFNKILVVVAAGNTGAASDAVSYAPANDPFVLTVGALDDKGTTDYKDDAVPSWSSRGTTQDGFAKPEIYTPGRHLISVLSPNSVLATQYPANIVGSSYFQLSGTSMAAGVASGTAALVFEAHPDWTPGQAKAALTQSAPPLPAMSSVLVAQADRAIAVKAPTDPTPNTKPNYLLLQAAGITDPQNVSWGSISWGSISWGSISWGNISWGSTFDSISWGFKPND